MTQDQKSKYESENRALACIKMSLPHKILHTFRRLPTAKDLWDALAKRCEGNAQVRKGKAELLKKQFIVFKHLKGESLDELITRYYHLITELDSHGVTYEETEKVDKILDALPS